MSNAARLSDLLGNGAVVAALDVADKKQLLQVLSSRAAACLSVEDHVVFDVLWEREKLGTTGVGQGIAIPHGRLPGIDKVCGFFARLVSPVAFDAVDDRPVDLVFLLLAPQDAGADHLHALAAVSKVLREPALCEKLRRAKGEEDLSALLKNAPCAQAA